MYSFYRAAHDRAATSPGTPSGPTLSVELTRLVDRPDKSEKLRLKAGQAAEAGGPRWSCSKGAEGAEIAAAQPEPASGA